MNWDQLQTVIWLRWRLSRNQWARGGNIGAVVAMLLLIAGVIVAVGLFAGAFVAGLLALKETSPTWVMLAWDIIIALFMVAWMIGLLTELQRAETIDLQRLMHLPVGLGQIFTVNYIASHAVLSIVLCVPAMIGLAAGLAISRTPAMLLLIPLALAMVFMITAWTYCLRGWLASLMANPRRRRSAVVIITMIVVLISQLPNIYFNVIARQWQRHPGQRSRTTTKRGASPEQSFQTFAAAQKFIPPFWPAVAAKNITEGAPWTALAATAGCLALGAAGLRRAYTSTLRFYRGGKSRVKAITREANVSIPAAAAGPRKTALVERVLPGIPEDASAMAMATLTSMLRAPEVKMQWAMSLMMTIIFSAMSVFRAGPVMPFWAKPLVLQGLITMSMFMLVQAMANQFGFDRAGFRALVLSPMDRKNMLLGKNLANVPMPAALALLIAIAGSLWLKAGVSVIITVSLQFIVLFLLVTMLGNVLSICVPYRIRPGSMKPTKLPAKAQLMMFLTHMLFPLVMAPAFIPSAAQALWDYAAWPALPVGALIALLLGSAAAVGYWYSLEPLARLLQRREMKILDLIGTEVE